MTFTANEGDPRKNQIVLSEYIVLPARRAI